MPNEALVSPSVVGPNMSTRPAYHSSSARSITGLQRSTSNGNCHLFLFSYLLLNFLMFLAIFVICYMTF